MMYRKTLLGFIGIPDMKYYASLFFVYIVSVLKNITVMAVICMDQKLRIPKYIDIFNLAFVDLIGSSALVPKVLDIFFFFYHPYILYDCLTFMFFCYSCLSMQSFNLVALCYDRLIAIIFPLHYQAKVTHRFMFSLIASFWLFNITAALIAVGFLTRLSYCKSVVIDSYFCDYSLMHTLACNDRTPSLFIGRWFPVLIFWLPLVFILLSYVCIGYALFKVITVQESVKAFKTCTAHILLVAIFYLPVMITFTFSGASIHPNARIINMSLTSVFPPMLNPIIYVLQTQEIILSLKKIKNQFKFTHGNILLIIRKKSRI
uniref:G-protein coupled receptors family 1 profile domain-containing protein n=1 Tax=Monopterus albus TaxID=43700 RepID=A0A3Q3JQT2_MONAL